MDLFSFVDESQNLNSDYDFNVELDFDLMGIEQEEIDDNEVSEEIKGWVKDKPKSNLEQTTPVNIKTSKNPKELQIRNDLTPSQKKDLIKLLTQFKDVFAWSHEDMIGLSTDIVIHRLPIKEGFKPIK